MCHQDKHKYTPEIYEVFSNNNTRANGESATVFFMQVLFKTFFTRFSINSEAKTLEFLENVKI